METQNTCAPEAREKILTEVVSAFDISLDMENIEKAAKILKNGGLAVFPTETVYGIGADALNADAVAGIFRAKRRPPDNPLIVHVTSLDEVLPLVSAFPEKAHVLAERFWPGPLTMILPKSGIVPSIVSAGLDTVAVRMPSHPVARAVIKLSGVPIAAPSANVSGKPSPTKAKHCIEDLSGRVDIIIDGGDCEVGLESTVISLAGSVPRLLRPGAVTLEELRDAIGDVEVDAAVTGIINENAAVSSPGMKYKHYAPNAEVTLVHGGANDFYSFAKANNFDGAYFLAFDGDMPFLGTNAVSYGEEASPVSQGKRLFSALRELDAAGAKMVFARAPLTAGAGLAVYNRILRAAGFREIYL